MQLWFALVGVFILQETVSTNAVLYTAYIAGYSLVLIHALFISMTIVDTAMGYVIGLLVQRRLAHMKAVVRVREMAAHVEHVAGKNGQRLALVLLGVVAFPHFNGLVASLLPIAPAESITLVCIGDILWYASQWLLVLGIHLLLPDPILTLVGILCVSVILVVVFRLITRKFFSRF